MEGNDRSAVDAGRSPYGERGLKFEKLGQAQYEDGSLSLRRAWIEIASYPADGERAEGRSPYGERGLKYCCIRRLVSDNRRSPYGERGLKFGQPFGSRLDLKVALLTESVD